MTLDEALFSYLTGLPALGALIGSRLYQDLMKQNEQLPAIVYSLDEDRSLETQQGPSLLRETLYRFDVYGTTANSVTDVGNALRQAIDGYHGAMADIGYLAILYEGCGRTRDPDTLAFNVSMKFRIFYAEAASSPA